jgi:hypothetical protein
MKSFFKQIKIEDEVCDSRIFRYYIKYGCESDVMEEYIKRMDFLYIHACQLKNLPKKIKNRDLKIEIYYYNNEELNSFDWDIRGLGFYYSKVKYLDLCGLNIKSKLLFNDNKFNLKIDFDDHKFTNYQSYPF